MAKSIHEKIRSGEAHLLQEDVTLLADGVRGSDEVVYRYAWVQLVVPLMLVRCRRVSAFAVAPKFLAEYPRPEDFLSFAHADNSSYEELAMALNEACDFGRLGLVTRRVESLVRVAEHLVEHGDPRTRAEVLKLKGVGDYVADSYCIFALHDANVEPEDRALQAYVASDRGWRRTTD